MIDDALRLAREHEPRLPADPWQHNSEGYRYLPWHGHYWTTTGLLLFTNTALFLHGMQAVEVYEDTPDGPHSLGFDVEGTGRYPMPPLIWDSPQLQARVDVCRALITPRVTRRHPTSAVFNPDEDHGA